MSDHEHDEITEDELEQSEGQPLPEREAMSTVPLPDPIGGFTLPYEPGPEI